MLLQGASQAPSLVFPQTGQPTAHFSNPSAKGINHWTPCTSSWSCSDKARPTRPLTQQKPCSWEGPSSLFQLLGAPGILDAPIILGLWPHHLSLSFHLPMSFPFFFFFKIYLFTFIFGLTGSLLLYTGFLQLRRVGATF